MAEFDFSKHRAAFAKRLNYLLKKSKVTPAELATKLGVNRASIYAYCMGKSNPSVENSLKIAAIFGVSVDWLYGRAGLAGRWELYSGEGACRIWRCSRCGNKVGPMLKDRIFCEKCGSRNGGNYEVD